VITTEDAQTFERCMAVGGFAVFPADTVYGLACDPDAKETVQRLHLLKRRSMDKPSAVMFFDADLALDTLSELESAVRDAAARLLPGPVTLLVPNPAHRFPLACGPDPGTLGLRVPRLEGAVAALALVRWPVMQSSANHAGEPPTRRLDEVPADIRAGADLVLDAGELPGTPSTVVDLRGYESGGGWRIVREGAMPGEDVTRALS
jgi:L-threonylcarbamoyladenylate synthase